jgi:hypothetical protein
VPNNNYNKKKSFIFGNKSNNVLQLGTILNNEASLLAIFFQISSWWESIFQIFWQFQN